MRALSIAIFAAAALAQTPEKGAKPLAFEVTSVKPAQPGAQAGGIRPMPGGQGYIATNIPLRLMFKLMYKITDSQIVGGPEWMNNDRWDVQAKAEKQANLDQLHEMFQTLLADRFQLQFHKEKRTLPALVLTVDKGGSKMKVSESQDWTDIPIKPGGPGKIVGTRVPMNYLCWYLSQPANLPVVDETGLTGFYDFTLQLPPPPPGAERAPADGRDAPSYDPMAEAFAALREQLGLKMESHKAPVEVYVIDRVERPSAN